MSQPSASDPVKCWKCCKPVKPSRLSNRLFVCRNHDCDHYLTNMETMKWWQKQWEQANNPLPSIIPCPPPIEPASPLLGILLGLVIALMITVIAAFTLAGMWGAFFGD